LYIRTKKNGKKFAAVCRKEGNFWYRQNSDQSSATLGEPITEPMNQIQEEK
jgi:hypothetical protein